MSIQLITKLRSLVNDGGLSRPGLARAAGLHANTLRDLDEPGWNPTAETLRKLESYLFSNDDTPALVSIEEIIEEARNGRMYILVDDEDRSRVRTRRTFDGNCTRILKATIGAAESSDDHIRRQSRRCRINTIITLCFSFA